MDSKVEKEIKSETNPSELHKENSISEKSSSGEDQVRKNFALSDLPEGTELPGVQKAEILASQDESILFKAIFVFTIFLLSFGSNLDYNNRSTFTQYSLLEFEANQLTTTIQVVSTIIQAAGQIAYARTIDIFGRLEMYVIALVFYVIGTIVQSQATSVSRYACGAVFYQLGYTGLSLIITVILSDFSSLRWRLYFLNVTSYPYIIITWMYGNVVQDIGAEEHWSWGIGMWAFILPLAHIPFACCFAYIYWRAYKNNRFKDIFGLNTQSIKKNGFGAFALDIFWKSDIVGLFLMAVCLGCILTPLTLAGGKSATWRTAHIIVPIVIGGCLLPATVCYEIYVSRYPIFPRFFLVSRGIIPPLLISFFMDLLSNVVSGHLYNVLLVGVNEPMTSATRIQTLSNFVSVVVGFFLGLAVVYIRHLKPFIIAGTLLYLLAIGLLIRYRGGLDSHSGIIAGECMMGLGSGFFIYPVTVVLQSHVPHDLLASITAMNNVLTSVGGAIGQAISGAIWTQLLYPKLAENLGSQDASSALTEPYKFIAKYAWGTVQRDNAVDAYKKVQKIECVVGIAFTGVMVLLALIIRERRLTKDQSIEGKKGAALKEAEEERWDLLKLFGKNLNKKNLKAAENDAENY